jgi:hypothetical protein
MRARILMGVALAVALADPTDYELVVAGIGGPICAKSHATCEQARTAIRHGWLPPIADDAPAACHPHPGCFAPESLCIANYNCGASR